MSHSNLTGPIVFEPIFMERVWGGRRLESLYSKRLPAATPIGESWEIVDRPEAQSVVHSANFRGVTLHELWSNYRREVFGQVPDAPRFPILAKLLDAQEKLSLQVHPPAHVAERLGGEPKTEFWYVADALPKASVFVGVRPGTTRENFAASLRDGAVAEQINEIPVTRGDSMFLPSGRLHALGAGSLIVEIQQNSDTTYRVYDWDRVKKGGTPRAMHLVEAIQCIDFDDVAPALVDQTQELLVRHSLFEVEKWNLVREREAVPRGRCAIFVCVEGEVECGTARFRPGDFFLVAAEMSNRILLPLTREAVVLRTTIPE